MRIGILTYQRAENYGALLQAYATFTYLRSLGHEVAFVDYWPKYHSDYFKLFPWQSLTSMHTQSRILFVIKLFLWCLPRFIRKLRFQKFMTERLELPHHPQYTSNQHQIEGFDMVIYGSDQIWRKQNLGDVAFDALYFGSDAVKAKWKIAYAGSMGTINTTVQDDAFVSKMMGNFDSISVREFDLQLYLENLNIFSKLVSDPVFLLSREQWGKIMKKAKNKEKYILFYNLLNTRESEDFVEKLSHIQNLPIKEVNKQMSFRHIGCRYLFTASVEQFLQLINEAEYVVSNSFHGVAMSIIFEKQFYAVGFGQRANRVLSLLQSLHISDRYVNTNVDVSFDQFIDYKKVNSSLCELISYSKSYLDLFL